MSRERQENLAKYEQDKYEQEISLENAQLCADISKYWATEDNEVVFWKKKEIEIREKYYGKNNPELGKYYDELAMEYLNCTKYKQSLAVCEKALKVKKLNNFSFEDLLRTYAIMMNDYTYLKEYEKGLELGREILNDNRIKRETVSEALNQIAIKLAYMCGKAGLKEEMGRWIEFELDLVVRSCGEDSVLAAEMYVEKAYEIVKSKDDKLALLKKALIIFVDKCGIDDSKVEDTFFRIWICWRSETDEPIIEAMKWLEKNLEKEYFDKIKKWRDQRS